MYRVLTHYVMMETYEFPDDEITLDENGEVDKIALEGLTNDEYRIDQESRDFEIVDIEHIV